MMKTFFLSDMPSISVKIWLMTLSAAPPASPPPPPLDLAMESNSSKNKMQGAACLACRQRETGLKAVPCKTQNYLQWALQTENYHSPYQTRLWHWLQILQTTWWASQGLWWRQSLPDTHWRWPLPKAFFHSLGVHRTKPHEMGSSQTSGTCQDTPQGTEKNNTKNDG